MVSEKAEVLARAKQDAAAFDFKINPKKETVERIVKGLIKNKHDKGEYYCPCKIVKGTPEDKDIICMCKEAREDHQCICGLFV